MASHDVDFDVAAANAWKTEVELVLNDVERELAKVGELTQTGPEEEDTIILGLKDAGRVMSDSWNTLCNGFSQMCTLFGDLINRREASFNKISESIESFKNSHYV